MPVDVSLLSQFNIPADALLSVRAGSVRRQAAIASGKPFRFPKIGIEESPVKIDILQTIGTAYIVVKPGEERYQAIFPGENGNGMACELELRDANGPPQPDQPEAKEVAADDAKAYLEKHKILTFVQAVLQTVIKERPDDPYAHIARHFTCGYDPIDERGPMMTRRLGATVKGYGFTATSPVVAAPEPALAEPAPTAAPAAAEAAEATPEATEAVEAPKVDAAAPEPEPAVAAPAPEPEDPELLGGLRLKMRDTLDQAHLNGALSEALCVTMPQGLKQPAGLDRIRTRMRDTLTEAYGTGALTLKLDEVCQNPEASEEPEAKPNVDDLRLRLRDVLVDANEDGSLSGKLGMRQRGKDSDPALDELRLKMKSTLEEAFDTGTLTMKLGEILRPEDETVDRDSHLRTKMRATLESAHADGSLATVLMKVSSEAPAE